MGGLKWVILVNVVGWSRFYVNTAWIGLGWVEMDSCVELDPEIKISHSHYKFLLKLTEIYWK